MSVDQNDRETGARKYPARTGQDPSDAFSQKAAENKKPAKGGGLSESVNDVNEKTRHADGRQSHPATEQNAGAGPALAKHTKDAPKR